MADNQQIAETPAPESDDSRGWGLSEPTLTEECRIRQDMRMVERALKARWEIPPEKREALVDRLMQIAGKTLVMVPTRHGIEHIDGPADANAVSAARVLVQMMGQNQADEHAAIPKEGTTVNVAVMGSAAISVEPDDDWYGNQKRLTTIAARHGADAAGSSVESHP